MAILDTNKTAALRALLRSQLAEQNWQVGAKERYDKVMRWLGPRLTPPKPPIPKTAFDDLYADLEGEAQTPDRR